MAEEKPASSKLHWPGWIWVVGHFLLFGYLLVTFIALLSNEGLFNWPVWGKIAYSFMFFVYAPLCLVSAIFMLINRRLAWFLALIILGASTLTFLIFVLGAVLSGSVTWVPIIILTFAAKAAWLAYFICARRRYGIGKEPQE